MKIKRRPNKRQKAIANIRDGIALLARQQYNVAFNDQDINDVLNHIATLVAQDESKPITVATINQAIINKLRADRIAKA